MDLINGTSPKLLKYFDNNYDLNNKKYDNAFPGKKIFESTCYINNNNNLNEHFVDSDMAASAAGLASMANIPGMSELDKIKKKLLSSQEEGVSNDSSSAVSTMANALKSSMNSVGNEDTSDNCNIYIENNKKYKKEIKNLKKEVLQYKFEYKIIYNPDKLTLHDHENEAIKNGGHLISIHDKDELDNIKDYWDKDCWLGSIRTANPDNKGTDKNTWKWFDGSDWNYNNFDKKILNNIHNGIKLQSDGIWNIWNEKDKLGGLYKILYKNESNNCLNNLKNCTMTLNNLKEKNSIKNENNQINKKFLYKSLNILQRHINNDSNQLNMNNTFESFGNQTDDIIKYNEELNDKQKLQKDKINLIQEKELSLEKTNALFKSSNDRNNFKKKIIYTFVALIFFVFILSISTYIYLLRDFKINN